MCTGKGTVVCPLTCDPILTHLQLATYALVDVYGIFLESYGAASSTISLVVQLHR